MLGGFVHFVYDKETYNLANKLRRGKVKGEALLSFVSSKKEIDAFFVSGKLLSIADDLRKELLDKLIKIGAKEGGVEHALFFEWAVGVAKKIYSDAESRVLGVSRNKIIEYLETAVLRMEVHGISADGKKYSESVLVSQMGHLVSTLNSVLYFISKKNAGCESLINDKVECELAVSEFWSEMAHYESIKGFIQEVANGSCLPVDVSALSPVVSLKGLERFVRRAKYYLDWFDPRWRNLEIYRDLNYKFHNSYEDDADDLEGIIKRSGLGRVNEGVMHFDLSRGADFELELKRASIIKLLELMYDVDAVCAYKLSVFTIRGLVGYLVGLFAYASKLNDINWKRVSNGEVAKIERLSLSQVCDVLGVPPEKVDLLELMSCNLYVDGPNADVAIYLIGEKYYIIPSHIMSLSFEKIVDRVVVRSDVSFSDDVFLDKGLFFENVVKDVVVKSGRSFYRLNRDIRKGAPEIDGVFNLHGGVWAVCEVKCSVKPECRRDAYQFIENHISGALIQLDERYDYLQSAKNVVQGFVFQEIEVLLLIITNHNYFTGLSLKTPKGRNVFVVDSLYLNDVLNGGFVPEWSYTGVGQRYIRKCRYVEGAELVEVLKDPVANLKSQEELTFQIQKSGIAIRIHKESVVDERSFYS
jgi:hypothetical protein